jgi:peptidoglycan/LPS O-acetylase OafA/YrhL
VEQSKTLDAIRGAAAIFVVISHAAQIWIWPVCGPRSAFFVIPGEMAVWSVATFFALSGVVIATSARRRLVDRRFLFSSFMKARLLRIFPPLLAAVVTTIFCVWVIKVFGLYGWESYRLATDQMVTRESAEYDWAAVLPTLSLSFGLGIGGYLNFNGPLWSLGYEFWLYVFIALFLSGAINKNRPALLTGIVGLVCVVWSNSLWLAFAPVWLSGFAISWFASRIGDRSIVVILAISLALAIAVLIYEGGIFDPYPTTAGRCSMC